MKLKNLKPKKIGKIRNQETRKLGNEKIQKFRKPHMKLKPGKLESKKIFEKI